MCEAVYTLGMPCLFEVSKACKEMAAYETVKLATKPSYEEGQDLIHKSRITLSFKNAQNLEKVYDDLSFQDNIFIIMPTKVLRSNPLSFLRNRFELHDLFSSPDMVKHIASITKC